jgi:hypothetical protein
VAKITTPKFKENEKRKGIILTGGHKNRSGLLCGTSISYYDPTTGKKHPLVTKFGLSENDAFRATRELRNNCRGLGLEVGWVVDEVNRLLPKHRENVPLHVQGLS